MTASLLPLAAAAPEVRDACGDNPSLLCRETFNATHNGSVARIVEFVVGKPLAILLVIAIAALASRIVRRSIKRGLSKLAAGGLSERLGSMRERAPAALLETGEHNLRASQRVEALASVLRSVASFVIWTIAAFMIMAQLGIDLAPLIAGAGIIGVAIGFGSQSLVKDFLSGLFILIEDQFGVGDIVDLGDATGTVEVVSLRTTRLRAIDGTVWHVPNGEIRRVGNKSQHWSRALLDIQVAYASDVTHARQVIKEVADKVWDEQEVVLEEPELWGVEDLGAHGVTLRLVVKTEPSKQWEVSRLLRERIKAAFDEAGIEIPFPQQTVWHRTDELAVTGDNGTN
jgi:small conductance mechanosensitive channel